MKHPNLTAEIEAAKQRASDDAPPAALPDHVRADRQRMVALRGRVIHNPDAQTQPRFALREDDGRTVALSGVYSDEDGWLVGARVEVEGRWLSESVVTVSKLVVRMQ
jgi:hypothetical protein